MITWGEGDNKEAPTDLRSRERTSTGTMPAQQRGKQSRKGEKTHLFPPLPRCTSKQALSIEQNRVEAMCTTSGAVTYKARPINSPITQVLHLKGYSSGKGTGIENRIMGGVLQENTKPQGVSKLIYDWGLGKDREATNKNLCSQSWQRFLWGDSRNRAGHLKGKEGS